MDSVSFARREGDFCCAETGERHKVARLKRMNVVPLRRIIRKATHRHSKKGAVVVVGRSVESCIQWSVMVVDMESGRGNKWSHRASRNGI
jgi:hypothetical protein